MFLKETTIESKNKLQTNNFSAKISSSLYSILENLKKNHFTVVSEVSMENLKHYKFRVYIFLINVQSIKEKSAIYLVVSQNNFENNKYGKNYLCFFYKMKVLKKIN